MNADEFGQKVKQKYPQYANIPNANLTQLVVKKYPQYASAIDQQKPASPGPGTSPPAGNPGAPMNPAIDQKAQMMIYKMFPQLLESRLKSQLAPQVPDALQASEIAKNYAMAQKDQNPPNEWAPEDRLTKDGKQIFYNKATHEETTGSAEGVAKRPKDTGAPSKEDLRQDRLEQLAMGRLSSIRGDSSLARVELQRDASIQAYKTISQVKKEKRMPSQIEYYDLLGQLWKARTGSSPSDQAIQDLDARTFKGNLGKASQYFTGKPAGVTTEDILNNIQNFVKSTGKMSDTMHRKYMATHLIKPMGLDEDRWDAIKGQERGQDFEDAVNEESSDSGGALTTEEQKELEGYSKKYGWK